MVSFRPLSALVPLLATLATALLGAGEMGDEMDRFITEQNAGLAASPGIATADATAIMLAAKEEGKFVPVAESNGGLNHRYIVDLSKDCSSMTPGTLSTGNGDEKVYRALNAASVTIETAADLVSALGDPCVRVITQDTRTEVQYSLPPFGLDLIDGAYYDSDYTHTLTGSGVDVYVLDTGIDANHDQLSGRVGAGEDFTSSGSTSDGHGHGTHCAGTIAGATVGVAPGARVYPMKVFSDQGSGSTSWTIAAVNAVIEEKRLRGSTGSPIVLSYSGGGGRNSASNNAFAAAVTEGIVTVVAAGNSGTDAYYMSPASEPTILTVGALDYTEAPPSWSNYGSLIDIWAPGVSVLSAAANTGSGLTYMSGTSMACPHVSGVAALMLEARPTWSPQDVERNLKAECSADVGVIQNVSSISLRTYAAHGVASDCAASGTAAPVCGALTELGSASCPTDTEIAALKNCLDAKFGDLCEGNGECGTNGALDNCGGIYDVYWKHTASATTTTTTTPLDQCGTLTPITNSADCPTNSDLPHCEDAPFESYCEGDGECHTDNDLNNCIDHDSHFDVYFKSAGGSRRLQSDVMI